MLNKAFKVPLLKPQGVKQEALVDIGGIETPQAKRRCISLGGNRPRKVLEQETVTISDDDEATSLESFYLVLWRRFTAKKNKTWDGDGVLSIRGGFATLQDVSGKEMGRTRFESPLLPGSMLSIGGKEVEVDSVIPKADFVAGKPFTKKVEKKSPSNSQSSQPLSQPKTTKVQQKAMEEVPARRLNSAAPKSVATKKMFKTPMKNEDPRPVVALNQPIPRHDPNAAGALVMKRPASVSKGKQIVDVVVDPLLSKHLREHQREGVKFLYECVMGMRTFNGQGAILADEMGLGKTLQTITLLWTLLKQNPEYDTPPIIKKALVVCPVTVMKTWRKEFRKWLGFERVGVFLADDSKTNLSDFTTGKSYSIMIIGYEKLRNVVDQLQRGSGVDLIIADEGHRLKTAQNKAAQAMNTLNTEKKIILSGTTIQNNLSEFFAIANFVNPGVFGMYNSFRRDYENPILRSQQPNATSEDREKGEEMNSELASITKTFVLRRTAELLAKYLPPKSEYVLLCRPTASQKDFYQSVISSVGLGDIIRSPEASLQLINALQKVCNSPKLISASVKKDNSNDTVQGIFSSITRLKPNVSTLRSSAKLQVLDRILGRIRQETDEKVVLISNYTSTLDLLQGHLAAEGYSHLRLDGSTPTNKRQGLVEDFNRISASQCFVFLLSAKAGGLGLNLIGASRLILFESDWNPATDSQAMARIHRDGQKRPCKIYRLLVGGTLDEKIWQRQISKIGLADSVMDQNKASSAFTTEELKDLFTLDTTSTCQTHALLSCSCGGSGKVEEQEMSEKPSRPVSGSSTSTHPEVGSLIRASEVDIHAQERRLAEKVRSRDKPENAAAQRNMQYLTKYLHVDTSRSSVLRSAPTSASEACFSSPIDDDILESVLMEEHSRVNFVFAKHGSSKKLSSTSEKPASELVELE